MKRLLFYAFAAMAVLLLLVAPFLAKAAERAENPSLVITYAGHTGITYKTVLTNKQRDCDAIVQLQWGGADTTLTIPAGETITLLLVGPYIPNNQIKARTTNPCTAGGNNGWLAVSANLAVLPIRVAELAAVPYFSGVHIRYTVFLDRGEQVILERSHNGSTWTPIANISILPSPFRDLNPKAGLNYYRLKLVEKDRTHYSGIVSARVTVAKAGTLSIYTTTGAKLGSAPDFDTPEYRALVMRLKPGMYITEQNKMWKLLKIR